MKAQSTIPLPTEPKKWKGNQFIYYFNHKDNGEVEITDPMQYHESRYTAEFTIIDSLDEIAITKALTRRIADPVLEQCIIDNIEVEGKEAIFIDRNYELTDNQLNEVSDTMIVNPLKPVKIK